MKYRYRYRHRYTGSHGLIRINHEYNRHGPGPGTSTTLSQNQHINTKKGESIQSGTTTYLGYPSYPTTGHVHVFVATVSVTLQY